MTELAWGCLETPVGRLSVGCTAAGVAKLRYGDPPGPLPPDPGDPARALLAAALAELREYFAGQRRVFGAPVDLSATSGARHTVLSVLHQSVGFGQTLTYGELAARAGLAGGGTAPREPKGRGAAWTEEREARNERGSDEGRQYLQEAPEASGSIKHERPGDEGRQYRQEAPEASGTTPPPARVVGQIMATNPVAVIVPCHRVVASTGLGGYSGGTGTEIKRWLLIFEGALPATLDWDPAGGPASQSAGRA